MFSAEVLLQWYEFKLRHGLPVGVSWWCISLNISKLFLCSTICGGLQTVWDIYLTKMLPLFQCSIFHLHKSHHLKNQAGIELKFNCYLYCLLVKHVFSNASSSSFSRYDLYNTELTRAEVPFLGGGPLMRTWTTYIQLQRNQWHSFECCFTFRNNPK